MAAKKGTRTSGSPLTEDQLREGLLGGVRQSFVAKPSDLAKALKLPKADQPRALEVLREAARTGALFRWQKRKDEYFFAEPPVAYLEREVPRVLGVAPRTVAELAKLTRVPKDFLNEWKKAAVAASRLYELPAEKGKKDKRLSLEPDLVALLGKALGKALPARVAALREGGVPDARITTALLTALGLTPPDPTAVKTSGVETNEQLVLDALRQLASERRAGALLLVGELRRRVQLDKACFDEAALALRDGGAVVLQLHDHAANLPPDEQHQLVRDARGNHYVGIALSPS